MELFILFTKSKSKGWPFRNYHLAGNEENTNQMDEDQFADADEMQWGKQELRTS